jgi:hypothetical protein
MFNIGRAKLDKHGFVNSYLFNGEEEVQIKNSLNLLFCPPDIEKFNDFIFQEKEKGAPIIDEKDYLGNNIIIVYKLPDKFQSDYDLLWEGKYSQMSEEFKKTIPGVVKYTDSRGYPVTNRTMQHMVFDRYAPLRKYWEEAFNQEMTEEQELWTIPTVESETFKLMTYEQLTRDIKAT